ncbi:MAG: sensor histidine kinase [Thermoleophilia bacterium]
MSGVRCVPIIGGLNWECAERDCRFEQPLDLHVCPLQSVMVGAPLGVVLLSADGTRIHFVNPLGRTYLADLGVRETAESVRAVFLPPALTEPMPHEAGDVRSTASTYSYSSYYFDGCQLLFVEDVTDRRRYESIALRADMENNTALFLSSLRHELGNPANSLKMALTVLTENYDSFDDEKRRAYLERCLQQVKAIEELLGSLKSYHAQDTIEPQSTPLDEKLADFIKLFVEVAESKGVAVWAPPVPQVNVLAHHRALHQVLTNVTTNALQALEQELEGRMEIRVTPGERYVALEVSDNGPGIDASDLRHVFTPLFTTKEQGTGLGLAIVRNLMVRMKGDVEIESEKGHGTVVRLLFARSTTPSARATAATTAIREQGRSS